MYNLIMKDILIQKKQFIFSLAYLAFILIAFQKMGEAMFSMGLVAFTYMLSMTSCAYEDKNKSDIMLNSLPVKRASIVAAKYISVLVYLVIGTLVYEVLTRIIDMLQIPLKAYPLSLETFIGGLVAVCLMTGIWFPIFYKFGYMKMRVANFVLFFLFFFGASFLVDYMQAGNKSSWAQSIISFLHAQSAITIAMFFAAAVIIFMLISFGLSVRFYKNREF